MYPSKKVVWAEGVLLSQQHFQQWEEHFSGYQSFIHQYQLNQTFGICVLKINESKLKNNIFQVDELTALMPDGRWLHFDLALYDEPLRCALESDLEEIYIALPYSEKVDGINGYPNDEVQQTAWLADYQQCADVYDPNRKREILYAKQSAMLSTQKHGLSDCCILKIAECEQVKGHGYKLKKHIPAIVMLSASSHVMNMIDDLLHSLALCIKQYQQKLNGEPRQSIANNSMRIFDVNLLSMLAKYQVKLLAYKHKSQQAPQEFYLVLCAFLNELSVNFYGKTVELMSYEPNKLTLIFTEVSQQIIEIITKLTTVENKTLELYKQSDNHYESDDISAYFKAGDYLYLEVHEYHDDDAWAKRFERGVKVGASTKIKDIYASAVAGVGLKYIKRPPSAINIQPGCEYFQLNCNGIFWQQVLDDGRLAIIKGKEFLSIDLKLIVIAA